MDTILRDSNPFSDWKASTLNTLLQSLPDGKDWWAIKAKINSTITSLLPNHEISLTETQIAKRSSQYEVHTMNTTESMLRILKQG